LLEPFGGEMTIDAASVRCDDADFPNTNFELALVTVETDVKADGFRDRKLETDDTIDLDLSDKFVNGECSKPDQDWDGIPENQGDTGEDS
jgi:hypothetical protein